jgi:hypothetical protein
MPFDARVTGRDDRRTMRPLVVLIAAFALFGAGCVSVEVIKKEQPAAPATTTEEAVTSSTDPLALPLMKGETIDVTSTVPEPQPASDVRFVEDALVLQATIETDGVKLSWTPMSAGNVEGYKIVRSVSDPLPWYPKSGAVAFVVDGASYLDRGSAPGMAYFYRVCAVVKDAQVACGNVVKIARP